VSAASVSVVIAALKKEVGYREGPNNANKYDRALGRRQDKWCQSFVQAILQQNGVDSANTAWTVAAEVWYKKRNRLFTKPKIGDQFFLYSARERSIIHTGVVTGVSGDGRTVYTIEGNSNAGGSANGNAVVVRMRPALAAPGRTGIRSYGRPNYLEGPGLASTPIPVLTRAGKVKVLQRTVRIAQTGVWDNATDSALYLVRGTARNNNTPVKSTKSHIKVVQGAIGVTKDGEWGPKSRGALKRAVQAIQGVMGVAPDGDWGPLTEKTYFALRAILFEGQEQLPAKKPTAPTPIVRLLQAAVRVKQDGEWGSVTDGALLRARKAAVTGAPHSMDRPTVKAYQVAVGAKPDGIWGPASKAAASATAKKIQAALGIRPNGVWGVNTEAAFDRARAEYKM
jgi:peptidoglycan hydrolase-like protein with peptidoglycan-binding domain